MTDRLGCDVGHVVKSLFEMQVLGCTDTGRRFDNARKPKGEEYIHGDNHMTEEHTTANNTILSRHGVGLWTERNARVLTLPLWNSEKSVFAGMLSSPSQISSI